MPLLRVAWVALCAIAFVPSNLCRGYSLREQYWLARIAVRWEWSA